MFIKKSLSLPKQKKMKHFTKNLIKEYFFDLHDNVVNQKYDNILPYSFHLMTVAKTAERFVYLIPIEEPRYTNTWIGIYGHDSSEDARLSYNDLVKKFNKEVAEIIFLCQENKGRDRDARKDENFYKELATNDDATFVKLCDIIANTQYSLLTNSSMYVIYKKEFYTKVKPILYKEKFKDMFTFLEKLYNLL